MDVLVEVEEEAIDGFEKAADVRLYRSLFRTPSVPRGHGLGLSSAVWLLELSLSYSIGRGHASSLLQYTLVSPLESPTSRAASGYRN